MNVRILLKNRSKGFYAFLFLLGIGNSIMYSGVLYFINNAVNDKPLPFLPQFDWAIYLLLIVVSLVSNAIAQRHLINLTNEVLMEYETSIIDKIRKTSYAIYEKIGNQKVYTALGDSWLLADFPQTFINSINALINVLCGLFYMYWINFWGGVLITTIMVVMSAYIRKRQDSVQDEFRKIRDLQDEFYRYINDLFDGFKEIKMNSQRNDNLYQKFIHKNRNEKKIQNIHTYKKDMSLALMTRYMWYLCIGMILFPVTSVLKLQAEQTATYIIIILYMLDSITFFVNSLPFYMRVNVALEKFESLNTEVASFSNDIPVSTDENVLNEEFRSVTFENITYEYLDENTGSSFHLGPINLEIRKGEILFIEGGNGSGKSTFINILTGLYRPSSGSIYFNDTLITPLNYQAFINKMTAIFTNNHIFTENYDGFRISHKNRYLTEALEMVELEQKVQFEEDKNWLSSKLSKGQQKRLALVLALLEKKEILVLDEWAAEQDPEFRRFFYNEILQRLQKIGKTLVLVTHDDRYFDCANRIVKFEYGKLVSDKYLEEVAQYY